MGGFGKGMGIGRVWWDGIGRVMAVGWGGQDGRAGV